MKVHVREGQIVCIETGGDEASHRMCARGRAYRQRVYAPDRLLHPLKRSGARGVGEFIRVSWDEALETVASEMKRVRDTYGNAAILHFCSMADAHAVHHLRIFHRLLCQFGGYTAPWGFISNEGEAFSAGTTYGTKPTEPDPEKYLQARLIIMWSWNPVVTRQGTRIPLSLARAKEGGTRFILVDPRYTDSAAVFADQWIPIRPGTDAAALVAMAYVIIKENLHDHHFVDSYTIGFDRFRDYVFGQEDGIEKTPEWAAPICGVPVGTITELAREYAGTRPAILETGYAAGRTAFGEQFHRAIAILEAITGNAGVGSSGPSKSGILRRLVQIPSPPNQVETDAPPRWNALPYRSASVNSSARVNINLLVDAILEGKQGGYPANYKLLWLSNNNYLNQLAEVNKAVAAFQKLEFILVTEQFMSSSAKFADIVLPVCTFLERHDLHAPKIIEPLGESRSQLSICEALARKLGITDYNEKPDEEWVSLMEARLSEEGNKTVAAPRAESPEQKSFPTPSGKIEIYSQTIAEMNHPLIPPIPKYIETWESLNDPLAKKYTLQLITPHFRRRAHSQFDNLPWLRELQTQAVTINTLDAEGRGIQEGDMVRVFNDRGEVVIPALVTERIMPGVVSLPEGAWYTPDDKGIDHGGCANVLTRNVTSLAGAFPSHTALVQIKKARE
jgi:anaerobic dimethyl sulfoxide reductase subunit A